MNKISTEIKSGIKLHCIKTDLYKTDIACVIITTPLRRESVTKNALIPFMLRRGTNELPSQYLINEQLENMYGASFNCGIDKMGDNVILKFYIESIDNKYALKKEAIDLALDLSRKVIEKNIDEEKNRQLIDEFISEVGN